VLHLPSLLIALQRDYAGTSGLLHTC
jgi:hypothetical protein